MPHNPGKAYLIGAGPGDPGLLTLRGRRLLGVADVVLYDYLANPRILQYARADAELVCLGRHGAGRMLSQGEIAKRMIAEARAGRIVARLKGGDPAIFGRTAEETAALEAAGIAYEIVPGVTSALAASSYAGIPLTHRAAASCVALVTGQECVGKAEGLDMEGLARFPGTLVFYMGVTSAPEWSAALVSHGKAADTPVAIVRHATLPGQQTVRTTLGELGGLVARTNLRPPALIFVGPAVAQGPVQNWFADRPLSGTTVMVTRPAHQADGLAETLESLGAGVVVQPAIEIGPPADWSAVDAAIAEMDRVQWIVFSSANGVRAFLDRIVAVGRDLRALGHVGIAAIGPATAAALQEYHLRCDVQPVEYRAEALAEALIPRAAGGRVLLVRASRGRETLAETLTRSGAEVVQAVAYESRDVRAPRAEAAAALAAGKIDWVTVTSSAIARSLAAMFGDALHRTKLAAISPLTAGVLQQAGYHVAAVASEYTAAGLAEAVTRAVAGERGNL